MFGIVKRHDRYNSDWSACASMAHWEKVFSSGGEVALLKDDTECSWVWRRSSNDGQMVVGRWR
jgi:hypothetical protein